MHYRSRFTLGLAIWFLVVTAFSRSSAIDVDLPLGDVNVLIVTDTHGWIAGHGFHEPDLNADYGDVLSFYERLRHACHEQGKSLYFVMNGDFVHGTGLSRNPPRELVPLLEKMPWDAVNVGNHELQEDETVEFIMRPAGFIDWWGDSYLTSNVIQSATGRPLGQRYRVMQGKNQGSAILTFGFLFNMEDASHLVTVERVEDVVKTNWFVGALRENSFDAVLVLAHMDVQDPLVSVILSAIRKVCGPDMPVQFVTGHTHYRGYAMLDKASSSFEAGRFLDTVGFVSFPLKAHGGNFSGSFNHVFLDANKDVLRSTLGVPTLATDAGTELSEFIRDTQEQLGLLKVVGCSPHIFHEDMAMNETTSLWGLYFDQLIPYQLFNGDTSKVLVQGVSWFFKYDLWNGSVRIGDIDSVVAEDESVYFIAKSVKGSVVRTLVTTLARREEYRNGTLPSFWYSGEIDDDDTYELYTIGKDVSRVADTLNDLGTSSDPQELFDGNTTVRSLWEGFVSENWPCRGDQTTPTFAGNGNKDGTNTNSPKTSSITTITVVVVVAVAIVFVLRYLPRWRRRYDSDIIPEAEGIVALVI